MNALLALWQKVNSQSDFVVVYDGWEKYLHIVYRGQVAGAELLSAILVWQLWRN